MHILWPTPVSSRPVPRRLKRDLLHTSAKGWGGGVKYAARQTLRSALERNPMHFIRGRVIQRDDSPVMAAVYSTTTLFAASHLWTQLDPEEPLPPPTQPSICRASLSFLVARFDALTSPPREFSGYSDEKHRKRGRPEVVCLRDVSGVSLLPVQCRSSSPKICPRHSSCMDCPRSLSTGEMLLRKSTMFYVRGFVYLTV